MTETRRPDLAAPPDVRALLDRWEHEGLVSEAQVGRIVAFEEHTRPPVTGRGRLVVEALAYLGGVLTLAAALLLVQVVWHDLGTAFRVTIPLTAAAALVLVGALVPGGAPDLGRLRSVLWLAGTAAWVAAGTVVGDQVLDRPGEQVVLLAGVAGTALALPLYLQARTGAQQLGLLVAAAMAAGALGAQVHGHDAAAVGLGVWLVALAWLGLGERGVLTPTTAVRLASAVGLVVGSVLLQQSGPGQVAAVVTLVLLFVRGVRDDSVALLGVGAVATLVLVPGAVTYWFPGHVGISVPLTLLTIGMGLVLLAVLVTRRRLRQAGSRHMVTTSGPSGNENDPWRRKPKRS